MTSKATRTTLTTAADRVSWPRIHLAGLALAACVAVPLTAGNAQAQTPPTVAPPPKAYPPPPPRWGGQPPPFEYPFTSPPEVEAAPADDADEQVRDYRGLAGFSLTLGVGPGGLFGPGENAVALTYQPFRIGYGLDRDLMVVLGFESVGTSSVNPKSKLDSWLKQDMWSIGIQHGLDRHLYMRGGLGIGSVSEKTDKESFTGGNGMAVLAAVGRDIYVRSHVAIALELAVSYTKYPRESWKTAGLQVAVSLF